jgi:hypothetical protein
MANRPILATMTGEHYQPVRLHYKLLDQSGLQQAFKSLRCLDFDPTQKRWVWLYDHEAKRLRFKQSYADLPEQAHPIVIGSFYQRANNQLVLDLRSCERATLAIPFFDKHIPRTVASVMEASVVNRLFSAEDRTLTPDKHFDQQPSTFLNPQDAVERAHSLSAGISNPMKKLKIVMDEMEATARRSLPEIERFPIHYYDDGIDGFALTLRIRQIVALQHWLGNTSFTMQDAIQLITKSM